ncbi:MAG: hypothetical protein NC236_01050 [Mycoplasma sp.]|nr:hypothetical protein [Mycoplasma sp.]
MKKIILTMGSLAMAATATVGTVLTVASCGEGGDTSAKGEYDATSKTLSLNVVADNAWLSTITDDFPGEDANGHLTGELPGALVEKLVDLIPNITTELKSSNTFEEATKVQLFKQVANEPWLNAPIDLSTPDKTIPLEVLNEYYDATTAQKISTDLAATKNLGDIMKVFNDATYTAAPKVTPNSPRDLNNAIVKDPLNLLSYILVFNSFQQTLPGNEFHVLPLMKNKTMQVYINNDAMLNPVAGQKALNDLWSALGADMSDANGQWAGATGVTFKAHENAKSLNTLAKNINGFLKNENGKSTINIDKGHFTTLGELMNALGNVLTGPNANDIIETPAAGTLTKSQIDLYKEISKGSALSGISHTALLIYAAQELTKA